MNRAPVRVSSAERITALLRPRSIAVVGASAREDAFGQRLLAAILSWRYSGAVYPVNPRYPALQGLACYPSLADLPAPVDCVAFAVSDERIEAALAEAAAAGARAGVIFGRCYEAVAPGRPGKPERLTALAREAGLAICGINCMGFVNFLDGLKVTGNPPGIDDRPGGIGLLSHSGSSWSGTVGNQRQLAFSYCVSVGQETTTSLADYLHFLVAQPETRAIGCILETVRDPENFLAALAAAERAGIPIAALKLGRSEQGRRFALAHSGAISGRDAVYQAVFDRHNVSRCSSLDELTDTLELLACERKPTTDALGAVTDSGGERQLLVDLAEDVGCRIAELSPRTAAKLEAVLDPGMTPVNPVDSYGDGRTLLAECLEPIAADEAVGLAALATNLVYGRPRTLAASLEAAQRVHASTPKPVVVLSHLHSSVARDTARQLRGMGIPVLMGTRTGLAAIRHFLSYHHRRAGGGTAAGPDPEFSAATVERWRRRLAGATAPLDAADSLALFADFGGPVVPGTVACSEAEALRAADGVGYPVVLKTAAPAVLHKTDLGGVLAGLHDRGALSAAYQRLASAHGPRVQVQRELPAGTEILLGMVGDPHFGPLMTLGLGGILVELLGDVVTFLPPVDEAEARAQLARLRGYPLLRGARGRPAVDLTELGRVISRFSWACVALGQELAAVDINPLIASRGGLAAVDALVIPRAAATEGVKHEL